MFLQRQFMYFDFHSTLKRNVPPANGFGPVSLNACNNILTVDWEGLFSDKSAIDVQRPTRINPLCTMHYKIHVKIGPRKDWALTNKYQSFIFLLLLLISKVWIYVWKNITDTQNFSVKLLLPYYILINPRSLNVKIITIAQQLQYNIWIITEKVDLENTVEFPFQVTFLE